MQLTKQEMRPAAVRDAFARVRASERELWMLNDTTPVARAVLEAALDQLRRSEAEFRIIIDAIPTQVWTALPDGSADFQNRTWREFTGLQPEEAHGSRWHRVIHPDDLDAYAGWWENTSIAGEASEAEARFRRADGMYRWMLTRVVPLRDEAGRVLKWYGTNTDIEDLKRAEVELRHSERALASGADAMRRSEQLARGQVEALVQSLDFLATTPPPEQLIVHMLSTIGHLLEARWLALWLVDETRDCLVLQAAAQGDMPVAADPAHPFIAHPGSWKTDASVQELFRTRAPVACEDIDADPRVPESTRAYFKSQGTRKFVRIPTLLGGEVKGFIAIHHGEPGPYQPAEFELAQALAHQAMLAIQMRQAAMLEERNRMARDIHDTLAQGFTAVIIQLQAAEDAKARGLGDELAQHLQSARELARDSLNEARRSVRALRPQALEEATFWEALQRLVTKVTAGTALRTSFERCGEARELPPAWQEHLLHICQEALTNTLKHARAARFATRLSFTDVDVRLELADDGIGFGPRQRHDGSGLLGMRERVARIGGKIEVNSASGHGTRVMVVAAFPQSGLA